MKLLVAGLTLLAVSALAGPRHDREREHERERERPVVVDRKETRERIDRAQRLLSDALLQTRRNRAVTNLIIEARAELDRLRSEVANAPRATMDDDERESHDPRPTPVVVAPAPAPPPPPGPPAPPIVARPIANHEFANLMNALSAQRYADGKIRVIEQASLSHYFLVNQVQQLLSRFAAPRPRLDAVARLSTRMLDRQNDFQLYGSFDAPMHKEELRRILGR